MSYKPSPVKVNGNHKCSGTEPNVGTNLLEVHMSKPSQELLVYYKNKASRIEKEYDELSDKLDYMKSLCDLSSELQSELNQKNEEVARLQQAVSDLQIYLYHEREQGMKLSAENDKLRIRELEDRKKIEVLLSLSGTTQSELMYFISTHPKALVVPQKIPPKLKRLRENLKKCGSDTDLDFEKLGDCIAKDPQLLILQNQSLEAQLEQMTALSRDQTQALLRDRELAIEERQLEKNRLTKEIEILSAKLKQTQDTLCETTAKLVRIQQDQENEKTCWFEEKDKLIQTVKYLKEKCQETHPDTIGYSVSGVGAQRKRKCGEVEKMKEQILQSEQMAGLYQEQAVALESEVARLKQQAEVCRSLFKERTHKMAVQVAYLKSKYDELDRRRVLEAEGFRTDIKMLRERLKELEKKLAKASSSTLHSSEQQLLMSARNTLNRAQQLERELNNIKNKISQMELVTNQ